jgi:glycosyltransferase involved in cell wall biosynthesis
MLAIAAPSFDTPSETFIRNHVRTIEPGQTILISSSLSGFEALGCLSLAGIPAQIKPWTNLRERILNSIQYRFNHYIRNSWTVELKSAECAQVTTFLRENRVQVLLVEYLHHACRFINAAESAGIPLFAHAHGYEVSKLVTAQKYWRRHYLKLFSRATGVIAASEFMARKLRSLGCPADKISICPCGVDPDAFHPTVREHARLVAVGRLVEKKAPTKTLYAFAAVLSKFPEARLDLVGDGPLRNECENIIKRYNLAGKVTLHGVQPSEVVSSIMSNASIFVQHSVTAKNGDTEGLGIAILEAMACSLPVVVTRHNGFVETVLEGETGLFVAEHDVDGMAAAICELLSNPERAKAMGDAGRKRVVQHFNHHCARDRLRTAMGLSPAPVTNLLFP